jgi:hypothetical protein
MTTRPQAPSCPTQEYAFLLTRYAKQNYNINTAIALRVPANAESRSTKNIHQDLLSGIDFRLPERGQYGLSDVA